MTADIVPARKEGFSQPTLKEGYTVLQVVKLVEYGGYSIEEAADRLKIPERSISAAMRYYEEHTDEIESLREEEEETVREHRYENSV